VPRPEEIAAVGDAWSEELARALRERSAWAHLGRVEVVQHRGTSTLGGYIDRKSVVLGGGSLAANLDAWRRTNEGRVIDRAVVAANMLLHSRLPSPARIMGLQETWLDVADGATPVDAAGVQGKIVALGVATDLVVLTRASLGSPARPRLHACAIEGAGGVVNVVTGAGAHCTMVAMVSMAPGPDGLLHVIAVLDVKTRGQSKLTRIDVKLTGS
jgi:hypothetical protein